MVVLHFDLNVCNSITKSTFSFYNHIASLNSISLNHLVSHTLIHYISLPFIFKLFHFFPYSPHYPELAKSQFHILHPPRTLFTNTWPFSLLAALQNNPKFTHSVPSLHLISILGAPRQSAAPGAKLYLLHHKPRDGHWSPALHQAPPVSAGPPLQGILPPSLCPQPPGAKVWWDTRYRGLRHSGICLIPWKCNYFQPTEGISSWISRSYKYDCYGINCCSFSLSSWAKLHFSEIPLTVSIHLLDLIQKWRNSSSIPIKIFFFTDFLIEPWKKITSNAERQICISLYRVQIWRCSKLSSNWGWSGWNKTKTGCSSELPCPLLPKKDVWTIPPAKTGSIHSPALATQSRQNPLHTDFSSWNLSSSAALWLLNPGAECLGSAPVQVLTLSWGRRAGEQPEPAGAATKCPKL